MKIIKKIVILIIIATVIYGIYALATKDKTKLNYIALGDSVAEGMNSYREVGYGYVDYIKDYLKDEKRLNFYTKGFSKSGYTTQNLMDDIENNKTITENDTSINIRSALREADLVTISIGANDFIHDLSITNVVSKLTNPDEIKREIDIIGESVEEVIKIVKQYAKKEIVLVGYYNPLPSLPLLESSIDEIVTYSNEIYKNICEKEEITYVDVFDVFKDNPDYLPNPSNIHPSVKGYEAISNEIIKIIKDSL